MMFKGIPKAKVPFDKDIQIQFACSKERAFMEVRIEPEKCEDTEVF